MAMQEFKLGMLLDCEASDYGYDSTRYLCLRARPVKVLANGDVEHFSSHAWPSEPMADLVVCAQSDDASEELRSYGWRVEYAQPHSVDLARAEGMVKVLRRVERRLEAMRGELGYPETFGSYLARVGVALGAKTYVWRSPRDGVGYVHGDAATAAMRVESMVSDWRKSLPGAVSAQS